MTLAWSRFTAVKTTTTSSSLRSSPGPIPDKAILEAVARELRIEAGGVTEN